MATRTLFDGDPRLWLDENGSNIIFRGGQPIMDAGLENAVLISLFTRKGWAGNALFPIESQKIGSDYELAHEQPIQLQTLNDVRNAAEAALAWMLPVMARTIDITVTNPSSIRIQTNIVITPPGASLIEIQLTKFGNNWIAQTLDPASGRL